MDTDLVHIDTSDLVYLKKKSKTIF
jgi:hypothetical protein